MVGGVGLLLVINCVELGSSFISNCQIIKKYNTVL